MCGELCGYWDWQKVVLCFIIELLFGECRYKDRACMQWRCLFLEGKNETAVMGPQQRENRQSACELKVHLKQEEWEN